MMWYAYMYKILWTVSEIKVSVIMNLQILFQSE